MFSKEYLNELLGYEKWVLRESILAIEKHRGVSSDSTIFFQEDGTKTIKIQAYSEYGAEKRIEILEKLSPLLFVTAYKVLDMVFEWILKENSSNVPWRFKEKIRLFEKLDKQSNIVLPSLLKNEKQLVNTLFLLYKKLTIYRNKIIHGNWGSIINGDLSFSFLDDKIKYNEKFTFKQIVIFSELSSMIAELLTENLPNSPEIKITIKYLLDSLKGMHQGNLFNIQKPRHYKVEYETGERKSVNIVEIKDFLRNQSFNHPFTFNLLVLSSEKRWNFPWEFLVILDTLNLNSNLDEYLI